MVSEATASIVIAWIPLLPLVGAAIHALLLVTARRLLSREAVTALSSLMVLGSLVVSVYALVELIGLPEGSRRLVDHRWSWMGLGVGNELLSIDLAFQFDALSGSFALMITSIGLAIHVYAVGFMRTDRRTDAGYQRFFCFLNLMLGAMLVLVLAENLPLMFLGWEAVGLCVAALMAFWYSDEVSAKAGNRAFVVVYLADVALLGAAAWLFWTLSHVGMGTLGLGGIEAGANAILQETKVLPGGLEVGLPSLVGLGIWLAVCARSAQLPLHFWYPDSARAPAPAVALVTLSMCVGVYLCCRFSFLFAGAPLASRQDAALCGRSRAQGHRRSMPS
jgi:NADH-quinone oxidoreductase subunit L